ncbi:sensor domain-containing diguanylate cyclase [Massilia pseudoviolaceinigra]|uniref:sensor domain-containing diguanylate cyclase n=1 Tax=Massilia pseudoviolaceinigra TaxID=3057165 RepID=UPI0027965943|nr:sensor domain-containing diguanylate cyclase [Massilia sp. CCM 9206]MDQ1923087.1 sensor domain-containing diguanylate cyclase [Massilia sp. CCM 9206]
MTDLDGKKRPLIAIAASFLLVVCISLVAVQGWSIYSARETQLAQSAAATANMARALADHADSTIELVDTILASVVESVQHDGITHYGERLHLHLIDHVSRTPSLQGMTIYDASGNWALHSLREPIPVLNNADREYFVYHKTHKDKLAHVGPPIRSRSTDTWVLPVSRRLEDKDGNFIGVALATVQLSFFRTFYDSFDIGKEGNITIALDSGALVMRRPYVQENIGTSIAKEPMFKQWRATPASRAVPVDLDTLDRMYSYRPLRRYPLFVAVGLSTDETLANWWANAYISTAWVVILLLILMWMGLRLFRQVTLRDELEEQLRNAQLALVTKNRSLKLLARNDGLTGIANRRLFDARLDAEFNRAVRDGTSLALVLLDVDFFKKYNDHYGHPAGDACLQFIGQCIRAGRRRAGNLAARVGGEEFAILLPNTDLYGAIVVAESVRRSIASAAREHQANPAGIVTISCGVHALVPTKGMESKQLVEAADKALYLAKSTGRNRVCPDAPAVSSRRERASILGS